MKKISQFLFYNGQYDRILQGQEGSALINSGAYRLKNCISSDSGELKKRLGTKLIKTLPSSAVIVPYRQSNEDDLAMVFQDSTLELLEQTDDNLITKKFLTSTDFPENWTSNSNSSIPCDITSSSASNVADTYKVWQQTDNDRPKKYNNTGFAYDYTIQSADQQLIFTFDFATPRILNELFVRWINTNTQTSGGHVPIDQYYGFLDFFVQYSDDNVNWTTIQSQMLNTNRQPNSFYQSKYKYGVNPFITEFYIFYIISLVDIPDEHHYWRVVFNNFQKPSNIYNGNAPKVKFTGSYADKGNTASNFNTNYTDADLLNIRYSQYATEMRLVAKDNTPYSFNITGGVPSFAGLNYGIFTSDGMPSAVYFFQNRLFYAGFSARPTSVRGSKFGDWSDYTTANPLTPACALNLTSNQLKNKIQNLFGGQNALYVFSEDGMSIISGNGTLIATDNLQFDLKNREPVGDAIPAVKDDVLYFVSSSKQGIYATDWDFVVQRFRTNRMSDNACDAIPFPIKEIAYNKNQNRILYYLMSNNQIGGYLTEVQKGINGFFPLETDGGIVDLSVLKYKTDYRLYLITNRNGQYCIEKYIDNEDYIDTENLTGDDLLFANIDNLHNNVALDCYQSYSNSHLFSGNYSDGKINLSQDLINTFIATDDLFAWLEPQTTNKVYTLSATPAVNDNILDIYSNPISTITNIENDVITAQLTESVNDVYYSFTKANSINVVQNSGHSGHSTGVYNRYPDADTDYYIAWKHPNSDEVCYTSYANPDPQDNSKKKVYAIGARIINWGYVNSVSDVSTIWTKNKNSGYVFTTADVYTDINDSPAGTGTFQISTPRLEYNNELYTYDVRYDQSITQQITIVKNYVRSEVNDIGAGDIITIGLTNFNLENYIGEEVKFVLDNKNWFIARIDAKVDTFSYEATIIKQRGNSLVFNYIYLPFTKFPVSVFNTGKELGVIGSFAYLGSFTTELDGDFGIAINLPEPQYEVKFGLEYESLAIIRYENPIESAKLVNQLNLSVKNTAHLTIGTHIDALQELEKLEPDATYDGNTRFLNKTFRVIPEDQSEMEKNIIIQSKKGLPFTIIKLDTIITDGDMGGE